MTDYKDGAAGGTPIVAAGLNGMQKDIADALAGAKLPLTLLDAGTALGDRLGSRFAVKVAPPTTAVTSKRYNPETGVYNRQASSLRRIRAMLGKVNAGTGYARISLNSDSTGVAAYGGDGGKNSPIAKVRTMLAAAGYPSGGTGLVPCFNNYAAAEPRITLYSGVVSLHPFSNMVTNSTTANGPQFDTTSTGETGTIIDVFYDDASAPFDVNIDSGAKVRVTPGGTASIKVYTVTGLADTTHQAIAWRVSGVMNILGFQLRKATGVQVYNASISGAKTDSAASTDYRHVGRSALDRTTGWGSDLGLVMLETNDAGNAVPVATYKANLQAVITLGKNNGTDMVLVTGFPLNGTDVTPYTAALYELADSNDVPLIDLQTLWGSWATANGYGLFTDNAHPNASGYAVGGRDLFRGLGL